jgi:hypothetical protein
LNSTPIRRIRCVGRNAEQNTYLLGIVGGEHLESERIAQIKEKPKPLVLNLYPPPIKKKLVANERLLGDTLVPLLTDKLNVFGAYIISGTYISKLTV